MPFVKPGICLLFASLMLCSQASRAGILLPDSVKSQLKERAKTHAERLLSLQKKGNHLWKKSGWWNSANIFESLIDYHRLAGKDFSKEMGKIYRRNLLGITEYHFVNPTAFDDNEWWALAWLKAYDMTGNKKYLAVSEHIFRDMVRRSWDDVCGGGTEWSSVHPYKNAVTNELFLTLSARLALETKDSAKKKYYTDWAMKEWTWFHGSKMFTDSLWISDGLNKDCSCGFNPGLDLTYNQGIVLGGLTYLYRLTGDHSYLDLAQRMAHASIRKYSNDKGVLTEQGDWNADKVQFKGIYIRYLALLNTELHDDLISTFILHNADHVWQYCRSSDGLCDWNWSGPFTDWSGSAQGSTMDLMNAALMQQ